MTLIKKPKCIPTRAREDIAQFCLKKSYDKFHPVFYFSAKTTDAESKYHSFELETLAVVRAFERFRFYLLGKHFTLVTDCVALKQTLEKKEINAKICRWSLQLQEFDFGIQHRKSDQMPHVDSLSRCFDINVVNANANDGLLSFMRLAQDSDSELQSIKERILKDDKSLNDYVIISGKLFRNLNGNHLFVVPRGMRRNLVVSVHDEIAHLGVDKTLHEIKKNYFFPNMRKYVKKCLSNCIKCLEYNKKINASEGFLHPIEKGSQPWHTIHIDHVGPLIRSKGNHRHIFEVIDGFSKFAIFEPTKSTSANESIKKLEQLFGIFGAPARIILDRGSAFTSDDFAEFCRRWGVVHVLNAVRTPRANGQIERYNRTIMPAILKIISAPDEWPTALRSVQLALNSTVQKTTQYPPSELFFGYKMRRGGLEVVGDLLNDDIEYNNFLKSRADSREAASSNIERDQERAKSRHDQRQRSFREYREGDRIVIVPTAPSVPGSPKMSKKQVGPYQVLKKLDNDRYVVGDIPGYPVKQKIYQSVLSPERMSPWISLYDPDSDIDDDLDSDIDEELDSENDKDDKVDSASAPVNAKVGSTNTKRGQEAGAASRRQDRPSCERVVESRDVPEDAPPRRYQTRAATREQSRWESERKVGGEPGTC